MLHVPCLSRNSLEPFASQILIPFLFNSFAFVHPLTNHRSSSATPRQNTRFVVRRGITLLRRLNLICVPKTEIVPVPKKLKIHSNFFHTFSKKKIAKQEIREQLVRVAAFSWAKVNNKNSHPPTNCRFLKIQLLFTQNNFETSLFNEYCHLKPLTVERDKEMYMHVLEERVHQYETSQAVVNRHHNLPLIPPVPPPPQLQASRGRYYREFLVGY